MSKMAVANRPVLTSPEEMAMMHAALFFSASFRAGSNLSRSILHGLSSCPTSSTHSSPNPNILAALSSEEWGFDVRILISATPAAIQALTKPALATDFSGEERREEMRYSLPQAKPRMLAPVAPVVKVLAGKREGGRSRRERSMDRVVDSTKVAEEWTHPDDDWGKWTWTFWSRAVTRLSAAWAMGRQEPVTKP